jgi:hypothetical protein
MDLFDDLQSSGIDFLVELIKGEWSVRLGSQMDGYRASADGLKTWRDAETWLVASAARLFPDSEFARKYHLSPEAPARGRPAAT